MSLAGTLANSVVTQTWAGVDKPLIVLAIELDKQKQLKSDLGSLDKSLTKLGFKSKDVIQVMHVQFGVNRSLSAGQSVSSGKPMFKNLCFVAPIDSYTALLHQACVEGEKVKKAAFSFVAHSGDDNSIVQTITLTDGYVIDVEVVNGAMYCQLTTRTMAIDNMFNKPMSTEFYDAT